ncbi:MAG: UDP-N-acetylmuramoyl-L-alanine--D-glutamate ligase [Thermodesulfobacteriota bacterium]
MIKPVRIEEVPAERRLDGCRAAVVGAGASGRAAVRLLCALGASVRLLEKDPAKVDRDFASLCRERRITVEYGDHIAEHFTGLDVVVLSPGVKARDIRPLLPSENPPEIMAELELAGRYVNAPILAITGTNGKSTTTALAGHVLAHAGLKVFAGGNLGVPLSELALSGEKVDAAVVEVSSFQAQGLSTFRPSVSVLLNFAPDHMDWHQDMEEYLTAKLNLFARMHPEDLAILPESMREELDRRDFTRARREYFRSIDRFECELLPGEHNQANMEAAYQACRRFGLEERDFREALGSFAPLPHRLQAVAEKRGVLFVDDSKATTVDAMEAALKSYDRPLLLLAGGVYKGGDLAALAPLLKRKVRYVCLFGASREVFEAAWSKHLPVKWEPDMESAVRRLFAMAKKGDVILLSPATASFDLYANYKERGNHFRRIAEAL